MMLTGDNGILQRAGEAKENTDLAGLKEEAKLVVTGRQIDKNAGIANNKTLEQDLKNKIQNAIVEEIEGITDVCYVTRGDLEITVYDDGDIEDGKVSIWKGNEDIKSPEFKKDAKGVWNWYIESAGQLKFLADFVNNGDGTTLPDSLKEYVEEQYYDITMTPQTTIYLMNNLDLGARQINGELTEGTSWTPIGINYNNVDGHFGTFDGNNYSIKGIYVKNINTFSGLFGSSNTIQNLTIKNSYIGGSNITGGIVGFIISGKMYKCHNINTTVKGTLTTGGLVGLITGEIKECSNKGIVIGNVGGNITGGIAGNATTISECSNNGMITGAACVGGVAGIATTISECSNNGTITGGKYVGGIGGTATTISKSGNSGTITGENYVGGIGGRATTISKSGNSGTITGGNYVGGIGGTATTISKSGNSGTITGGKYVGGIGGTATTISECSNKGIITGMDNVGGIVGTCFSGERQDISLCYNSGEVKGRTRSWRNKWIFRIWWKKWKRI